MKINEISLNCCGKSSANGIISSDFMLYLFKTPVIFGNYGAEQRMQSGSAIIYSGGFKQYYRSVNSQPVRFDCVSFKPSSADKSYIASIDVPLNSPVKLSDDFVISSMLKSMNSRFLLRGAHYSEFMELSMRIIFITISEEAHNDEHDSMCEKIPHYPELLALRERIYANPAEMWTADEISDSLDISRTYFHRLYLSAFGVTCRRDIIESRLVYASELLKDTDLSVGAIAEKCGYESDSYFMRQFRQYRGCTPTEYRRKAGQYE